MEEKSPNMNNFLNSISQSVFGRSRSQCVEGGVCVACGGEATEFRNTISRREFGISGMCQKCQDGVFGKD